MIIFFFKNDGLRCSTSCYLSFIGLLKYQIETHKTSLIKRKGAYSMASQVASEEPDFKAVSGHRTLVGPFLIENNYLFSHILILFIVITTDQSKH